MSLNPAKSVLTTDEAATILNMTPNNVTALCRKGYFQEARQTKEGTWILTLAEVEAKKAERKEKKRIHQFPEGTIGTAEAANILGLSEQRIKIYCREGRFSGAKKPGKYWEIPIESIEVMKKQRDT